MPPKIAAVNELTDNAAAMAHHRCELCGATLSGHGEYDTPADSLAATADPLEVIQRIALFMADDWKACCVLLLFVASPSAPLSWIASKIRIKKTAVHQARNRAADRFPELGPILGKKTPAALGQKKRWENTEPEPELEQPRLF